MTEYVLGIDVSHHQLAHAFDWKRVAETQRFCIARACYGTKPDEAFVAHFTGARDAGLTVGAYTFFRQGQPWEIQHVAFEQQLQKVSYGVGCIVPVVDLEWNDLYDGPVQKDVYNTAARCLIESLAGDYGRCMAYLSPGFFQVLGSPPWLLAHPWWIAHYTSATEPWCPFRKDWSIWQFSGNGKIEGFAGELDLNRARDLTLITGALRAPLLPMGPDWEELQRERDAWIRDREPK